MRNKLIFTSWPTIKIFILVAFCFIFGAITISPKEARATVEDCEITIDPPLGTTADSYTFTLTCNDEGAGINIHVFDEDGELVTGVYEIVLLDSRTITGTLPVSELGEGTYDVLVRGIGSELGSTTFTISGGDPPPDVQCMTPVSDDANCPDECESLREYNPGGYRIFICTTNDCDIRENPSGDGYYCEGDDPPSEPQPVEPSYTVLCSRNGGSFSIDTAFGCIPIEINQTPAFLLKWAAGVAGGLGVALIILAGFQFATSSGDRRKLMASKETLYSAITGLLLLILSVWLVSVMGVDLLSLSI